MSTGSSHHHNAPHTVDPVYTAVDSAARFLIDRLRKSLTSVRIRSADYFNNQTRNLLQQCLDLIPPNEKDAVELQLWASV